MTCAIFCMLGWCCYDVELFMIKWHVKKLMRTNKAEIIKYGDIESYYTLKSLFRRDACSTRVKCPYCRTKNMLVFVVDDFLKIDGVRDVFVEHIPGERGFRMRISFTPSYLARFKWAKLRNVFRVFMIWIRFRNNYYLPPSGKGFQSAQMEYVEILNGWVK
jgi:hypothetical protein